jgi:pilus assembly protein CpaE
MQSVLRIVLVDPNNESREDVKRFLTDMDSVWLEAECARYDELPDVLKQTAPEIVVLGLDADPNQALDAVANVGRTSPVTRVFVTSYYNDSQRILQAMRAGSHEYLTSPVQMEELLPALDRVRQLQGKGGPGFGASQVIGVAGVVGGVGSTSLAVNLGCALAADTSRRVVLVDLDMIMGDADVYLDLVHNYTLIDVVENISRLDFTLLKRSVVQHKCGLWFLPHPNSLADVGRVDPESLGRLIGLLKATFTHVIMNLSIGFRDTDVTAMQAADSILLVAQLDVSCVRNLNRLFKAMEGSEGILSRIKVVLNRLGSKDLNIPIEKAEETIGRKVFWQLPNDWQSMAASRTAGVPVVLHAPKSKIAASFTKLAHEFVPNTNGAANGTPSPRRRGLFAMLTGSA